MSLVTNKIICITGSSRGIGRAWWLWYCSPSRDRFWKSVSGQCSWIRETWRMWLDLALSGKCRNRGGNTVTPKPGWKRYSQSCDSTWWHWRPRYFDQGGVHSGSIFLFDWLSDAWRSLRQGWLLSAESMSLCLMPVYVLSQSSWRCPMLSGRRQDRSILTDLSMSFKVRLISEHNTRVISNCSL